MRTTLTRHICEIIIVFASLHVAKCDDGLSLINPGAESFTVTEEYETPHYAWYKPSMKQPIKALFIGPYFALREAAELSQRMDITFTTVMTDSTKRMESWEIVSGRSKKDIINQIEKALQKPLDLIIIGNQDWDSFPRPVLVSILEKAHAGTGLLYSGKYQEPNFFKSLLSKEHTPVFAELKKKKSRLSSPRFYSLGKGTIILTDWSNPSRTASWLTNGQDASQQAYDHSWAILIKLALWCAGKEPEVDVAPEYVIDKNGIQQLIVKIISDKPDKTVDVVLSLINEFGETVFSETHKNIASGKNANFQIPDLFPGRYWARILAKQNNAVAGFASSDFMVLEKTNNRVDLNLELDKPWYMKTDKPRLRISVNKEHPDLNVSMEVKDCFGRRIDEQSCMFQKSKADITLIPDLNRSSSIWHRIIVRLLDSAGKPVSQRTIVLRRVQKMPLDFPMLDWGAQTSKTWMGRQLGLAMREIGFFGGLWGYDSHGVLQGVPLIGDFLQHGKFDKGIRTPCLSDPDYLKRLRKEIIKRAAPLVAEGCVEYTLGDEPRLGECCIAEPTLKKFRMWLREQYPDLESLNREWKSNFAMWDDVRPHIDRNKAIKQGSLASWLDHRLFMDKVVADFYSYEQDCIRELFPEAGAGPEGLHGLSPYQGIDYRELSKKCGVLGSYFLGVPGDLLQYECINAFTPYGSGFRRFGWFGTYNDMIGREGLLRAMPWIAALHGYNSIGWWRAFEVPCNSTDSLSGITPDWRATRSMRWALEEIRPLQTGLWRMLQTGKRQNDGIAILFSRPSMYACGFESFSAVVGALQENLLQFCVIDNRDLSVEKLQKMNIRLLILPSVLCLSDKNTSTLLQFVKQGGNIIADLPPGMMDEHGCPRKACSLGALFGIDYPENLNLEIPAYQPEQKLNVESHGLSISQNISRLGCVADDATAAWGTVGLNKLPAIKNKHKYGGNVWLLNFALEGSEWGTQNQFGNAMWWAELWKPLLSACGVNPKVSISSPSDKTALARGMEIVRYQVGDEEYLVIFRHPLIGIDTEQVLIRYPEKKYCYDSRSGKFLGYTDIWKAELRPGSALVYALLNEKDSLSDLKLESNQIRAGDSVKMTIQSKPENRNGRKPVFFFSLKNPKKETTRVYEKVVTADSNGFAECIIPLALNDSVGQWQARVKDVATGLVSTVDFNVSPASTKKQK